MFKKYLLHILLLFILINCVLTQGPTPEVTPGPTPEVTPGPTPGPTSGPSNPPSYFRHPNDEPFYDMEKKGKKPKDILFKLEDSDNPNIIVDVVELKDQDKNNDIITNKSKLKITWSIDKPNNMNINMNNNLPQTFTLKLLSNVTQDSETKLFYSCDTQIIQPNVNEYQFEYNVPKLNENYVYNIAVVTDTNGKAQNDIGISKTFIYKLHEKENTSSNSREVNSGNKGVNPLVFVSIGIAAIVIIGLAFLISKGISKNDRHVDDDDQYNLPIQSPSSSFDFKHGLDDKNADHNSTISDDTWEVSWSNLEIAQTSQQTKNAANDNIYITIDNKRFKRDTKDKNNNAYAINENQLYKVVRMFIPTEEDEIKLNIGDEVKITEIFEDGWCEGINNSLNQSGVFPRICVVEAEQYSSMIEKSKNSLLPNRRSRPNSYLSNKNNILNNEFINDPSNTIKE